MTTEWRVVANYWKANQGWTHEEEVDTMTDYMNAEMYVNSLDDEELVNYFRTTGADAIQFDVLNEDGNKVSDYWLDRDDVPADEFDY